MIWCYVICFVMITSLCYAVVVCPAVLCYANTMLCCAMLYYALLCYTILCYAMLCQTILCYGVLCYGLLCYIYTILCCVMLYYVYSTILCCAMLYHATLRYALLYFRFLMVFICLLLSVFSTIEQYEEVAGLILYYMVRSEGHTHYFTHNCLHKLYNASHHTCCIAYHSIAQRSIAQHSMAQHSMAQPQPQHIIVQLSTTQHSTA